MLGPIGSNLMSILRVLTPSEIDMYSEEEETIVQPMAVGAEQFSYEDSKTTLEEQYRHKLSEQSEEGAEQEDADPKKAKIIPINKKVEQQISEDGEFFEPKTPEKLGIPNESRNLASPADNSLNAIGILSKDQIAQIEEDKRKKENSKKDSTSVFILNQRENLKQSRMKMVEQKAIAQYKKNASAEIFLNKDVSVEDEIDEDSEMRESGSKGILVNKRHY